MTFFEKKGILLTGYYFLTLRGNKNSKTIPIKEGPSISFLLFFIWVLVTVAFAE